MEIKMFWRDQNWENRGYANHIWLHIYPDEREYQNVVTPYCDISGGMNIVEVKRKSDIEDMIKYLEGWDYKETKR